MDDPVISGVPKPTPEEAIQALPGVPDPGLTPPTPPPTAPASPGPLMAVLGPLLFAYFGPSGSFRRQLLALPGVLLLLLNHRVGLNLTLEEQGLAAGLILGIVTASNAKEASVTRSNAMVQVAKHEATATITAAQATAEGAP